MVDGGPIDVLTGDYLAELTMSILHFQKKRDPESGYARSFLKQFREIVATCIERNIKIVCNAGGLNPGGMARDVQKIVESLNLSFKVAWIDGDDLVPRLRDLMTAGEDFRNLETGKALEGVVDSVVTANAYLGCWGIKEALDAGADLVICPRVTDAALVIGPAAWKFAWARDDFDALAGALAAGHIIECGTQATGGNYCFFEEVPGFGKLGFPIAEIERDGSFTITKHDNTGGIVSRDTIIAQLLYEIGSPEYLNPDVIGHFDSLRIEDGGRDRVRVTNCRGSMPPATHKVCINIEAGYRSAVEILLTGLDIEKKAKLVSDTLFTLVGGREQFDDVVEDLIRGDRENPRTNQEAFASLRIVVKSKDPNLVGGKLTSRLNELSLASIPGYSFRGEDGIARAFAMHWPCAVSSRNIVERVHVGNSVVEVTPTRALGRESSGSRGMAVAVPQSPRGEMVTEYFGRIFGTRSGDKGGNANLGVWARSDGAYGFLHEYLTVEKLKALLPDLAKYEIQRFDFPNMRALNFLVHGLLGTGASGSSRLDPQAKTLGEYLRAKRIEIPRVLISA